MNELQYLYTDADGRLFVCAWCAKEADPNWKPGPNHTGGICQKHLQAIKAETHRLKRMEALVS